MPSDADLYAYGDEYHDTAGCSPKLNFLDDLEAVVERANLPKTDFWLHKFRATFARWHL